MNKIKKGRKVEESVRDISSTIKTNRYGKAKI